MHRQNKAYGFTIVELLIVIVVIAILATISIVAYTGIQNRANDTAVQSDIRNFATKVMEFHAINGRYPLGSGSSRSYAFEDLSSFSLARGSYSTDISRNFTYCVVDDQFAIGAASKSGNRYYISSSTGAVGPITGTWGNNTTNCTLMLGTLPAEWSFSYGYNRDNDSWGVWTR